jgi:hypothetical protein
VTFFASFGDLRAESLRLTLPAFGRWTADVHFAVDSALPDTPLPLTVGNLALLGSVVRGGPFAGSRSARIVGGFGGWGESLPARWYALTSGVRLSAVLKDAAMAVGESAVVPAAQDRNVGPFFARLAGPASRVLAVLVGRAGWYIDALGLTRLGDRESIQVTSAFSIPDIGYRPNVGHITIATEDLLSWQPGAVFSSDLLETPLQVSSATINLEPKGRLRLEVLIT